MHRKGFKDVHMQGLRRVIYGSKKVGLSFKNFSLFEIITLHKAHIPFVVTKLRARINFSNVKVGLHRLRCALKAFQDIFCLCLPPQEWLACSNFRVGLSVKE